VRREIERVSKDWPRQKGELKGGQLQPEHLETLVDILFRHDALLHVCAVDVSKEDPAALIAIRRHSVMALRSTLPRSITLIW
jgi:hypothetical protein